MGRWTKPSFLPCTRDLAANVRGANLQLNTDSVAGSRGFNFVGGFFFFGAVMACFAGLTLLRPGTFLDRVWKLNPTAHALMIPHGKPAGMGFLLLSTLLALAGVGWFQRRFWGWVLGVVVISSQVMGDLVNLARGDWMRGAAGVLIASCFLAYLLTSRVRAMFRPSCNGQSRAQNTG